MTGVTQKALRALLTDPDTGNLFDDQAIVRGSASLVSALAVLLILLILALGTTP